MFFFTRFGPVRCDDTHRVPTNVASGTSSLFVQSLRRRLQWAQAAVARTGARKKNTQPQITPLRTNVFMARPRRCGGRSSAVRVAPPPQRSKCCGRRGTRTTDPATHVALYRRVGLTYLGSVPAAGGCVAAAALALPRTPLSGRSRPHLPTLRARARLHGDVPRPEMHRRRLHGAGEAGGSTPRLAV